MFQNTEAKHEEIRNFAKQILANIPSTEVVDEWHQIDDFHDVHISEKDETEGEHEVWVYPVVLDKDNNETTDTSDPDVYYEVIL